MSTPRWLRRSAPRSAFAGFHRVEQILWTQPSVDARPVMADLMANVTRLQQLAAHTRYTSLELTSGATELLNEIEATKITGEEERYSHLDLVDIRGNDDGAEKVIDAFRAALRAHAPALLTTIGTRSARLEHGLARYAADPGYDHSGYVRFDRVTSIERRQLSALVEALAQAISLTTGALNT
jgi:iron uptake system component EfeO